MSEDARAVLRHLGNGDQRQRKSVESFVETHLLAYVFRRSCLADPKAKCNAKAKAAAQQPHDAFTKCVAIALHLQENEKEAADVVEHYTQVNGSCKKDLDSLESICLFYFHQRSFSWLILHELLRVGDDEHKMAEYHDTAKRLLHASSADGGINETKLLTHIKSLYERSDGALAVRDRDAEKKEEKCWLEALLPVVAPAAPAPANEQQQKTAQNARTRAKDELQDSVRRKMAHFSSLRKEMILRELEHAFKSLILYLRAGATAVSMTTLQALLDVCMTHNFDILLKGKRASAEAAAAASRVTRFQYLVVFAQVLFCCSSSSPPAPTHPIFSVPASAAATHLKLHDIQQSQQNSPESDGMWTLLIFLYELFLDVHFYASHPQARIKIETVEGSFRNASVRASLEPLYSTSIDQQGKPLATAYFPQTQASLELLNQLVGVGLTEKQNDVDKLMLPTYQAVLRELLSKLILQAISPSDPVISTDILIGLVEKLYKPQSSESEGSEAFWLEWKRHEADPSLYDLERIRPAWGCETPNPGDDDDDDDDMLLAQQDSPIEFSLSTPLCVLLRMFQEYSSKFWGPRLSRKPEIDFHDNAGFPRLLLALSHPTPPQQLQPPTHDTPPPYSYDCLLHILNKEIPLRSIHCEEDLCNLGGGVYGLRNPPPPTPFQFASLENAINVSLLPMQGGEIVNIFPVSSADLVSIFSTSTEHAIYDSEHIIYDVDVEDALARRGLATASSTLLVQEMIHIVNSNDDSRQGFVDRRSMRFGALEKYCRSHPAGSQAGFADALANPGLVWRQQAQQRLRLLIGQKYEVQWSKRTCWWKLLLEAVANPNQDSAGRLEKKASALKVISALVKMDKIETLLELNKQWNDAQLYYLLQDFFCTPPHNQYMSFLDDVYTKLRSQILPEEYHRVLQKLNDCNVPGDELWQWQRCAQGMTADALVAIGRRILARHMEIYGHVLKLQGSSQSPDEYKSFIEVAQLDEKIQQELFLLEAQIQGKNLEQRSAVILCLHAAELAEKRAPSYYNSSTACCDAVCKTLVDTISGIVPLFTTRSVSFDKGNLEDLEKTLQKTFLEAIELLGCFSECPFPWSERIVAECADRFGVQSHLGEDPKGKTYPEVGMQVGTGFAAAMLQIVQYEALLDQSKLAHSHAITSQVCRFFSSSLACLEQTAATVELKKLFEETDTNNSGDLSREELSALLTRRGYVFSASTIDELFREIENPLTCGITYSALFKYAMSPTGLGKEFGNQGAHYQRTRGGITELRRVLQQLTTAGGITAAAPLLSCNMALSMMDYSVHVFTSLSAWEFADRCRRWETSLACLTTFHGALERVVRTTELSAIHHDDDGSFSTPSKSSPTALIAQFLLHRASTDGGQLITAIVQSASLLGLSALSSPKRPREDPISIPLDFESSSLSTATEFELSMIIKVSTVAVKTLSVLIELAPPNTGSNEKLLRQLGFVLCTAEARTSSSSSSSFQGNYLTVLAGTLAMNLYPTLSNETSELQLEILRLLSKVVQCTASFAAHEVTSLLDVIGASNVPALMSSLSTFFREFLEASDDLNKTQEVASLLELKATAMLDLLLVAGSTQPTMFATLIACQAIEKKKISFASDAKHVLEITKHIPEDSEFLRLLLQGVRSTTKLYDTNPAVLHKLFSLVCLIWDKFSQSVYLAKASLFLALSPHFWTHAAMPLEQKSADQDNLFGNIDKCKKEQAAAEVSIATDFSVYGKRGGRMTVWESYVDKLQNELSSELLLANVKPEDVLGSDFFRFHSTVDFLRWHNSKKTTEILTGEARERSRRLAKECHVLMVHAAALDLFTRETRGVFAGCIEMLLQHNQGDEERLRDCHRDTTKVVPKTKPVATAAASGVVAAGAPAAATAIRETCMELMRVLEEVPSRIEKETHAFLQKAHSSGATGRSRFKYWLKFYLNAELDEKMIEATFDMAADMGINLRHLARNRPLPTCEDHYGSDHEFLVAPIENTAANLLHGMILAADTFPDATYGRLRKPWSPQEESELAVPSLETDLGKYFRWCDLTLKMSFLNNMWSVSNAKGYLLRAARRFFSTHVGEKPQRQKRSILKKAAGGRQGRSGSEANNSPVTPSSPSLAGNNVYSPMGVPSGAVTPSGMSAQPSMLPGDLRSYELVKTLLDDLIDQFNESLLPIERRRTKSFLQVDIQALSEVVPRGKGRNALLAVEKYELLLSMLSLQLQSVVSRAANPMEAMIVERESWEMRMSPDRIEKYLQKLSCIYEAQVEALERSDPEELIATPITYTTSSSSLSDDDTEVDFAGSGRALTLHDPDIRRAVKLPLLTSMLLLLNRMARDRRPEDPADSQMAVSRALSVPSPRSGGGGADSYHPGGDASYHRLQIFQYALKTLREETQDGWILAFSGASQLSGQVKGGKSPLQHAHELPYTFIRCVDGMCLRPGVRRAPLVQVSLRLLKAALPRSTASDEEDERWVAALDSNSGVLVLVLRELCSSKEACDFVRLEHDYSRWQDKTRPGSASSDLGKTKDDYAEAPASQAPKRGADAGMGAQASAAVEPADLLAALKDLLDVMFAAVGLGANAFVCQHLTRGGLIRELTKSAIFRSLQEVLTTQTGARPSVLMGYSARTGEAALALECWERVLHILTAIIKKLPAIRLGVRDGYHHATSEDDILKDVVNFVSTYADLLLLPMHSTDCRFSLRQLDITTTTMYFLSELTAHTQWQSSCPNLYANLEVRASYMVKKSSVALYGGADHKDLDSVFHQRHLKRYVLAVAKEERNQEGPPSSRKMWDKFKRDFAHISAWSERLLAVPDKAPKTPTPASAPAAPKPTPAQQQGGFFNLNQTAEKLDFSKPVTKPGADAANAAAKDKDKTDQQLPQQQQQAGAAAEEEESRPRHPMAFLLVKMEISLMAALVPIVSFLVQTTPDPFGVPGASPGHHHHQGFSFNKDKLLVGTTCFYRNQSPGEEHPHLFQGVIRSIVRGAPTEPHTLEVVLANGRRDAVTSSHIVYLQRPLMNFLTTSEIARDNVGLQHDAPEEAAGGGTAMVVTEDEGAYSAALGMEREFLGDAGARRELALGAATAHLLMLLKFVTNETVNRRLIPDKLGSKRGEKGKVSKAGQGDAASNIILDLSRLFGQLAWCLYANCKHHLLAMQHDQEMKVAIVKQLDELKDLLRSGESLYGPDSNGNARGFLSCWYRLDTITTKRLNPTLKLAGGGGDEEDVNYDLQRLEDWEEYRSWLLELITSCKDSLGSSRGAGMAVAVLNIPTKRRKGMELETI